MRVELKTVVKQGDKSVEKNVAMEVFDPELVNVDEYDVLANYLARLLSKMISESSVSEG